MTLRTSPGRATHRFHRWDYRKRYFVFKEHDLNLITILTHQFNLRAIFLEEAPFVNYVPPDNETGECKMSRSVPCRGFGDNNTSRGCCAGFCIDLFQKFAHDLKFTYDLSRVEDGAWGILNVGFFQLTFFEY